MTWMFTVGRLKKLMTVVSPLETVPVPVAAGLNVLSLTLTTPMTV